MSPILELGTSVHTRRSDMGLTQAALARLSGLSRATVNQVENGTLKDLSLTRAAKLLDVLGLSVLIASPRPRSRPAEIKKSPALDIAARTASVSFKEPLTANRLREVLTSGAIPPDALPHVFVLVDEAPVSLLAAVVEQLHLEEGMDRALAWKRLRDLARVLKSSRALWQ